MTDRALIVINPNSNAAVTAGIAGVVSVVTAAAAPPPVTAPLPL